MQLQKKSVSAATGPSPRMGTADEQAWHAGCSVATVSAKEGALCGKKTSQNSTQNDAHTSTEGGSRLYKCSRSRISLEHD